MASIMQDQQVQDIIDNLKREKYGVRTVEKAILILGSVDSEKRTFMQFMIGNDDNLTSVRRKTIGEIKIVNKEIINTTITLKSTISQLITQREENLPFYDCPEFSDIKSAAQDIAEKFFIKKVIDSAKSIKLIFIVSYYFIVHPKNRHNFRTLIKHAVQMIKNIEKFKSSMALIVTTVNNHVKFENGEYRLLSDDLIIKEIAGFLKRIQSEIQKSDAILSSSNDQQLKEREIKFIDILLEQDEYQNYIKIGIFRKTDRAGSFSTITLRQIGKQLLKKLLDKNIQYSEHDGNDFRYNISFISEKNDLHHLVSRLSENIISDVANIGRKIKKHYRHIEGQSHDIEDLYNTLRIAHDYLNATKESQTKFVKVEEFYKHVTRNLHDLNISIPSKYLLRIKNYVEFLKFIDTVSYKMLLSTPVIDWDRELTNLVEYLGQSYQFYSFLICLENSLSQYTVQQNISQYMHLINDVQYNVTDYKKEKDNILESIKSFIKEISNEGCETEYNKIKHVQLNNIKLTILKKILNETLKNELVLICTNDRLIIKGQYIRFSSIFKGNCSLPSKSIDIMALRKVFIDTTVDWTGKEVQLSIIAPIWEVVDSQKIILDGKNASAHQIVKARNGIGPGSDGDHGKPGRPGGPAGNFIGIGQNYVDGEKFSISVKGGTGGQGQHGGDGVKGIEGVNISFFEIESRNQIQWGDRTKKHCITNNTLTSHHPFAGSSITVGTCYVYTRNCTNGGRGGDGGYGGYGGSSYNTVLINFEGNPKVIIINAPGKQGFHGNGGKGRAGGISGHYYVVDFLNRVRSRVVEGVTKTYKYTLKSDHTFFSCQSGENGIVGNNKKNIEISKIAHVVHAAIVVNNYKNFLRENLINDIKELSMRKFLNELDNHESVKAIYDTLGLVNELQGLEEQFYKLHDDLSFLPFYKSLLNRVLQYAEKLQQQEKLTADHKKVLSYLYTATLSKICSIDKMINVWPKNLSKYLDQAVIDVNEINDLRGVTMVNDYEKNYQEMMDEKIYEAQSFITKQIIPEIDEIFSQVDRQIELLITETVDKQNEKKEEKKQLEQTNQKLENALLLRHLLMIPKVASQFLSFLGPVGATAGAVIGGSTMVVEALALGDIDTSIVSTALPEALKMYSNQIKNQLQHNQELLKVQLSDVSVKINEFSKQENDANLNKLEEKISNIAQELQTEIDKTNKNSPDHQIHKASSMEAIQNLRAETKNLLQKEKMELEEKHRTDDVINIDKKLTLLNHVQNIMSITEVSINHYENIRQDKDMINKVGDAMKKVEVEIEQLNQFETNIYRTIIPKCRDIENMLKETESNLQGKSHATLDVSKWQIQVTLDTVKHQLDKMTDGFIVHKDVIQCIEKLKKGITLVIDMYNNIEKYRDKKELIKYIANINLSSARQIRVNDKQLNDAISQLEMIIQTNLILEKYTIAVNTFKQCLFPFAAHYIKEFDLPSFLQPNNINGLVLDVATKLKKIKEKVVEYSEQSNKYTYLRHNNIRFGNKNWDVLPPFFVWKYSENKRDIYKLLEGTEVILKSDVRNGVKKNAIKFNEISIRFVLGNQSLQQDFDNQLKYFELSMKHLGTSYYRCNDKFYSITSNNTEVITQLLRKNEFGESMDTNVIYDQLKNSDPVLSPYAMWSIKLADTKNETFNKLVKYKYQEMDLELEGRGQYVNLGIHVCNDDLSKYYVQCNDFDEINNKYDTYSLDNQINYRLRRKANNYDFIQETKDIQLASSAGNVESSLVNRFFNFISNILMMPSYYLLMTNVPKWFFNKNINDHRTKNIMACNNLLKEIKFIDTQSLTSDLPVISINSRDNELPPNKILSDFLFFHNGNILLLDSLIRWKRGIKYKCEVDMVNNDFDVEHALKLAYQAYVN